VEPAHRGAGIGKALLKRLAALAAERGCGRLEWRVLDWNEPSIRFYESLGASLLKEWILWHDAAEFTAMAPSDTETKGCGRYRNRCASLAVARLAPTRRARLPATRSRVA
jgi:RimJ/RimL family protein N-acetyltransferase